MALLFNIHTTTTTLTLILNATIVQILFLKRFATEDFQLVLLGNPIQLLG